MEIGAEGIATTVRTNCRICLSLCGLEVVTQGDKVVRIVPDRSNPYNWRDFCAKGGSADRLRTHPKRLRSPMKRVGDRYVAVSHETAVSEIAKQLDAIRTRHGADAIACYSGNPAGFNTAGSAFLSGFMSGLGSVNNYGVGSIDQNSAHVVAQAMYGCETALLVADIDHAKCILLLGSNPQVSYMHWTTSIAQGWERVLAAKQNGADLIIVDPRTTPSTRKATTHVAIRPGEDWAFLLGLIKVIFEQGWQQRAHCAEAVDVQTIECLARDTSLAALSQRCKVPEAVFRDVARRFATAPTSVCEARTGVSHTRNGTLGEWLSHVLNLICGRIDQPGGRYFQPGIYKNTLKTMRRMLPHSSRRSRVKGYPAVLGAFPLATLPDEILVPGPGQVRALIINAGNPVVSGPDGARLDAALQKLELLIGVDLLQRESHRHAHWLIPGCHFLEREDFMAVFGGVYEVPFAQLSLAAVPPPPDVRPEWEFFRDLSVAMGVPFMGVPGLNAAIRLTTSLARLTGKPRLAFGPRWLWASMVKSMSTIRWRDVVNNPSGILYRPKTYGHLRGQLQTADGRIHAAPEAFMALLKARLADPSPPVDDEYPLQLVNQRRGSMMNSWLVETVKQHRLTGDKLDMHPHDAAERSIEEGETVAVASRTGRVLAQARLTEEVPRGIVSLDHGWGSRVFDPLHDSAPVVSGINRNLLVAADDLDELSGIPKLNGTAVQVIRTSAPAGRGP